MQTQFHFKDCGKHPKTQPTKNCTGARHKETPCRKASNNNKEVSIPGSQFCSFLANKKGLSHNCAPQSHSTGGEVLIVQFRFGKVRNHFLRSEGNKNKSSQSHPPPEQAAPTALKPVTCLRPRRKGILQAHPPRQHMGRQEFKAPQQPFLHLLWAARSSDPI